MDGYHRESELRKRYGYYAKLKKLYNKHYDFSFSFRTNPTVQLSPCISIFY